MSRTHRISCGPVARRRRTSIPAAAILTASLVALVFLALQPAPALAAGAYTMVELLEKDDIEPASSGFPVPLRLVRPDLSGESESTGILSDRWHSSDAFEGAFRDEFLEGLAHYLTIRGFDLRSSGEALDVKVTFTGFEGRKRFHDDGGDLRGTLTLAFRGKTIAGRALFESLSYSDQAEERPAFAREFGLPRVHFATVLFYRLSLGFYRTIEETILAVQPAVAEFFVEPGVPGAPAEPRRAGQPPAGAPGGKGMDLAFAEPTRASRLLETDFPVEEFSIFDITSTPAGAEIYLDEKLIATTPAESVRIPAGTHKIAVRKPGYREWTRELLVLDGNRLKLKAELEKAGK